jgi:glyoxylase-like metal-dependent hydrolase (beta-lactamase superfamily II)
MKITERLAIVASLQFGICGPYDCHVYALSGTGGLVLIDAGGGSHVDCLLANVASHFPDWRIEGLLLTHCHLDHCGGAAGIRRRTGCAVFAPEISRDILESGDDERSGLRAARERGVYGPDVRLDGCAVHHGVRDGEAFTVAGLEFLPIHVRGHSVDAFCYLTEVDGRRWLFTGDAVFYGGVLGVINAEGSGMDGYRSDIGKLRGLDVHGLFPAHGLFTMANGQRHLDCAIEQARESFVSRQIGQWDRLF